MAYDEAPQRSLGLVTLKYVLGSIDPSLVPEQLRGLPTLEGYSDKDYGPVIELALAALEMSLGFGDVKDAFLLRHLATFLISAVGAWALFRAVGHRFADWRLGLLAVLFLVTSPRLFADSFYNSKDIAFMAVFAVAMRTTVSFVLRPSLGAALPHALATACAIDVRIVAAMLPVATIALSIVRLRNREVPLRATLTALASYLVLAALATVAFWPWLWSDPLGHFVQAFRNMSQFRWGMNVLYGGEQVRAHLLPWHYIPVWIAITTPVPYLVLFFVGAAATLRRLALRGVAFWRGDDELQDVIAFGLLVSPIVVAVLTGAVLYDGWRQMYFIYPAFVVLTIKGWVVLWRMASRAGAGRLVLRSALAAGTAASILLAAGWMWQAHPFQNVYFNALAGKHLRTRYELDYWGLANRMGLEYILAHDRSAVIHITTDAVTAPDVAFNMIQRDDRARLRFSRDRSIGGPEPKYLMTNWRYPNVSDNTDQRDTRYADGYDPFHRVEVDGEAILSIFRSKGLR